LAATAVQESSWRNFLDATKGHPASTVCHGDRVRRIVERCVMPFRKTIKDDAFSWKLISCRRWPIFDVQVATGGGGRSQNVYDSIIITYKKAAVHIIIWYFSWSVRNSAVWLMFESMCRKNISGAVCPRTDRLKILIATTITIETDKPVVPTWPFCSLPAKFGEWRLLGQPDDSLSPV